MKKIHTNERKTSGLRGAGRPARLFLALALMVLGSFSLLYGQEPRRDPIDINLIIDASAALSGVKDGITAWLDARLDQIAAEGDRVTVWSAGSVARVIYSGTISGNNDLQAVKASISGISPFGDNADFSGALTEAAGRGQNTAFSYTLLISASPQALSSILSSPQANLLRFSRIEEFTNWRALVVGLNLEARVRRAAAAFFGS